MKTIVVTGGAGFLGSNLCIRLVKEGNKVIAIDNLHTGRKENLHSIIDDPNFTFVEANIIDKSIKEKIESFAPIDEIYNLACIASPPAYQEYPVQTILTSVVGVMNLLEVANRQCATLLQSSTSEVYGEPEVHPQVEEYRGNVNPIGLRACYDEGKRCAETLCFDFHRQYGTKVKIVRIFNTYGPNMYKNDGRVVSNFINQALNNEGITIYGDGSQTRSFCYVDDLVEGLIKMMQSRVDFLGPVNLGNPGEFTISELAEEITKIVKTNSRIVYKELPADDPTRRRPSIELAKKELGWEPKVALHEGLIKTIEYYRNYKEK